MNASKVVLVQPPVEDFYLTRKRTIPYGLACIAANITKEGFDVEILDGLATNKSKTIEYPEPFAYLKPFYGKKDSSYFSLFHEFKHFGYSFEHLATQVRKRQPFIVGISALFTPYFDAAVKTAKAIKKFWPRCHIVMGGHHPTLFPEKVLEYPYIDFVLRGEGEASMPKLCSALKDRKDIKDVPGIAFREQDGVYLNEPSWEKDFNVLPLPATHLIRHDFYQRNKKGSAMVVSSRGCPMKCSYCSVSASSAYAGFRQRSIPHVMSEIKSLVKDQKTGFIDFEDENLCLNKSWFMELFSQIRDLEECRDIELRAMNGLFPPAIDEDIICLMKEAGFKTLNLSLGSTSKEQLQLFKRPDVRKSFENALNLAGKYGLECVAYIITAAPGQHIQTTIDDLLYLAKKRTLIGLSVFYPAPGSLDYDLCRKEGLLPDNFNQMRSSALPLDDTISRLQTVTLLRLSRILNFAKQLKDTLGKTPGPLPFPAPEKTEPNQSDPADRMSLSLKLYQWFLHDGKIRGVQPDGKIFEHLVDKGLALEFSKKIRQINISGIK